MASTTDTELAHSFIDGLPDEALGHIFKYCTPVSFVSICCVCKRWHDVFAKSTAALPKLKLSGPLHLSWLQHYAKRLIWLTLRRVDDLSSIAHCANLQSLCLQDARHLEDLSPLTTLPSLATLTLANCRTTRDLSPLLHVRQLTALTMDRCFARDLTPLSGHARLQDLHLAYDCWSAMGLQLPTSLPGLKRMRIMSAVPELSQLAAFPSLQELMVYAVSVFDLSPLSHLTNLQELDLHQLQEELHAGFMGHLAVLHSLKSLGLQGSDSGIVELTPWHCLTGLTRVDLHGSCVSDLQPLQTLSGLVALHLTEARELMDLTPLSSLNHLSELVLTGCRRVQDLSPVLHILAAGGLKKP